MMTPRYSRSHINRVGDIIVDDNSTTEDLDSALATLSDWRALHIQPMDTCRATLRKCVGTIDPDGIVTQRLKRTPTIIDKLKNRQKSMNLGQMQDVGGLRAVVDSIESVRKVEKKIIYFQAKHTLKRPYDYIAEPKISGYRGIHLVYEYCDPDNMDCDGLLIEIQIRTRLQHLWATAVETAGFFFNESLKSSQGSEQRLEFFQLVSALFAHEEEQPTSEPFRRFSRVELADKLRRFDEANGVLQVLDAIQTIRAENTPEIKDAACWVIRTTFDPPEVWICPFDKSQRAVAIWMYRNFERSEECKSGQMQVVWVSADSVAKLEKAYPNFFLDIGDFIEKVFQLIYPS